MRLRSYSAGVSRKSLRSGGPLYKGPQQDCGQEPEKLQPVESGTGLPGRWQTLVPPGRSDQVEHTSPVLVSNMLRSEPLMGTYRPIGSASGLGETMSAPMMMDVPSIRAAIRSCMTFSCRPVGFTLDACCGMGESGAMTLRESPPPVWQHLSALGSFVQPRYT